jgi:hypothetical protein
LELRNLESKSNSESAFIAKYIKDYDIIAIQRVVAGYGGAQAVARLTNELNKKAVLGLCDQSYF